MPTLKEYDGLKKSKDMKDVIKNAREKLDKLKEQDRKAEIKKKKADDDAKAKEDREITKKVKERAKEIYATLPKKIEEALKERKDTVELYGYSVDTNHNYQEDEDTREQRRIINSLKELLKKDDISCEEKTHWNNEGHYGSDNFGNPSYWKEIDLIVKF